MDVWIGRDGKKHGPYHETDVRKWLLSGQVSPNDHGWHDGMPDWLPLATLFSDDTSEHPPMPDSNNGDSSGVPPEESVSSQTRVKEQHGNAGFWKRVAAWIIDNLILTIPGTLIAMSLGAVTAFERSMAQIGHGITFMSALTEYQKATYPAIIITMLIRFVYYVVFECSTLQATPGKLALGLRVTDLDGGRPGLKCASVRNVVRLAHIMTTLLPFICYIAVAFTARKQGLHDLMAQTLVLDGRASPAHATDEASLNA